VSSRAPLTSALGGAPVSEVLAGERFDVLELSGDLAWGVAADGAVGFVRLDALSASETAGEQRRPSGEDVATAAEALVGTPYQMGGRSPEGVDSAGLVYLALQQAGQEAPRFLDLMAEGLGAEIPRDAKLGRGDVLLWADHAAIAVDEHTVVHVTDGVVREPLAALASFGDPIARRRP
jgi:cell wall-associated NlpC family hydrolase